ncbi:cytochrome P450 [Mucor mucedo]|uniref:cytochrome P450 n=1 Tax=Mucor mucedo TaxID=29922 RepID=UPI00221F0AD7|nr:cytochrome P450 [Mucor mucedo]KAI7891179.1 cytochrome P450 [Mucor mucedo]
MINYQLIHDTIQRYLEKHILFHTGLEEPAAKRLSIQLGVSAIIIFYFYKLILYRLYLHPANSIPGPKVGWIPLMGNFFEIMKEDYGATYKRWGKQYGGIFTYHAHWNVPRVVVTDHVLVKQVLTSNESDYIKSPEVSDFLRRMLGDGLLIAEGDVHRYQRKMLNPAFSVNAIRSAVRLMAKPGHHLRDTWLTAIQSDENKVGKGCTEVQVSSGLSLATLDVIGWAFGQDFKALEFAGTPHQSKLSQAYLHLFSSDVSLVRLLTFLFPILRYLPTTRNRLNQRDMKWLNEESRALVQAGIERAAKAKESGVIGNQPKDLLAIMVDLIDEETGQGFTAEELKNQCLTFLAAGHETTSVTLSWALWLLAKDQAIQDELRSEVRTLFKDDTVPSYEDINALPLLNNVIRETLRLIPAVSMTFRVTRVPTVLGSYVLPMGTHVFIPAILSHHSTEIWGSDAEEFNPKRWDNPDKLGNAYQYMPFLAGIRHCIGSRLRSGLILI